MGAHTNHRDATAPSPAMVLAADQDIRNVRPTDAQLAAMSFDEVEAMGLDGTGRS